MKWNSKYWDIVDDFYWVPNYLGLKSIGRKKWTERDGLICVPSEQVNRTGPLYTRERKATENVGDLRRKEEILNHMFDLTFAIAGDSVVWELLVEPLGFEDRGPFESFGKEVRDRYGWGNSNVTQQDGLFVSRSSIVGVELKTGSGSSPEQILKYVLLMCCEEYISGPRRNVGLLYIVPENSRAALWRKCGVHEDGQIDASFLEKLPRKKLDSFLGALDGLSEDAFKSLLDRLHLAFISWTEFDHAMREIVARLDPEDPGDQTLMNLLNGFRSQVAEQEGTGI